MMLCDLCHNDQGFVADHETVDCPVEFCSVCCELVDNCDAEDHETDSISGQELDSPALQRLKDRMFEKSIGAKIE